MKTMSKDYYSVLGLSRSAADRDINKAYRNLSLQWHPEKNASTRTQAEATFQKISEAFQVLSNRHLRTLYDKYGKEGLMENRLVDLDFNGFIPRSKEFPFKEPCDVYLEFFGGKDPAMINTNSANQKPSGYDEHCFENSFSGFPKPQSDTAIIEDLRIRKDSAPYKFTGSMFSGPNDERDYRSQCTTKLVKKGKETVTYREVLNDEEKVTVEENGTIISKTLNGIPQLR